MSPCVGKGADGKFHVIVWTTHSLTLPYQRIKMSKPNPEYHGLVPNRPVSINNNRWHINGVQRWLLKKGVKNGKRQYEIACMFYAELNNGLRPVNKGASWDNLAAQIQKTGANLCPGTTPSTTSEHEKHSDPLGSVPVSDH